MKNETPRKYGKAPFAVAVIHGGPGAAGEMAPVARALSGTRGVLEPLQTKATLEGQIRELKAQLQKSGDLPVTLIGYSWGAMLGYIFTARNPSCVKKLVLVASAPFEDKYAAGIMKTRLSRLTEKERMEAGRLLRALGDPRCAQRDRILARFGQYCAKADSYDAVPRRSALPSCRVNIFENVWNDALALRRSGTLVTLGKQIRCPVVAIHGDHDPHPAAGVKIPLSGVIKTFRFIRLKNCGHCPWQERAAREKFYALLSEELR